MTTVNFTYTVGTSRFHGNEDIADFAAMDEQEKNDAVLNVIMDELLDVVNIEEVEIVED